MTSRVLICWFGLTLMACGDDPGPSGDTLGTFQETDPSAEQDGDGNTVEPGSDGTPSDAPDVTPPDDQLPGAEGPGTDEPAVPPVDDEPDPGETAPGLDLPALGIPTRRQLLDKLRCTPKQSSGDGD